MQVQYSLSAHDPKAKWQASDLSTQKIYTYKRLIFTYTHHTSKAITPFSFLTYFYTMDFSDVKSIFSQLEPELLSHFETLGQIRFYKSGETLMRPGQYIRSSMLVLKGRLKVFRESDEGAEFLVYYLGPGEACAVSLVCAVKSETSEIGALAVEDTTVLTIPLDLMDQWMTEFRTWYQFVLGTYRTRFEELLMVIDQIAFRSLDERLEFYLKRMADGTGSRDIFTSHQDIARDLNSSREVISRLLKKMEQRGLVQLYRNHIEWKGEMYD
jgi:CRP/FNR family transcriptional regulator, anaerobic regulatory protein